MEKGIIGFYCSSISWGGLEMNFIKCASWLASRNYRVKVYCVKDSPIDKELQNLNLSVNYVKRNRKYYDFVNAYKISKIVKSENIKAFWIADTRDISTIGLAKTFSSNKCQIIYHQNMQIGVNKKDWLHTIRFLKIDAWISLLDFLSEQVKNRTKFPEDRIHTIPLAVDISSISEVKEKIQFNLSKDRFVIGVIGRLSPQKGQLFLIQEVSKLVSQGKNVELLIVGETTRNEAGDYKDVLDKAIAEENIHDFVHIHPFLKDPILFYDSIDLFVMASLGETFGTVTIEAMKCGVPILGTNASGTPAILENGSLGYLYEVNDSDDFQKNVNWILNNPEEVKEKAVLAKEIAEKKYSKNSVINQMEEMLSKLNLTDCKTK